MVIEAPLFRVIVPDEGATVTVPFNVSAPPMEKLVADCVDGVAEMLRFLNVRVPELLMVQAASDIVIVPALGEKVEPVFTTRSSAMLKLLAVVTVAELAIVKS